MADYVIIPDISCDLSTELRERFGVDDYLPGIIYYPDGSMHQVDLDWGLMTPNAFYDSMSDRKSMYRTAYASPGDIQSTYERYLSQGKDILSIVLSTGVSGTYQSCEMVRRELLEKYPQRKIVLIDSLRYSTSLALLVIMAAQKRAQGASLEENAQYIEQNKHCIHQMGPMDDLFFLVKTGRISNFKAFFGSLVGINPMADFNHQGMAQVLGKFKGKKNAFDAVIDYMHGTILCPEEQIIFVAHSNREQAAQMLADRIQKEFSPKEIIINHVGMSSGASIGPGLCAAFYYGKPISVDMSQEQALMNNILEKQKKK